MYANECTYAEYIRGFGSGSPVFPISTRHVDLLLAVISSHQQPSQHSMYIVQLVHITVAIAANEQKACSPADWKTAQGMCMLEDSVLGSSMSVHLYLVRSL